VVLLHGFAGGAATWVANWRAIAAHANVHAVDMPGWARSERHKRSFDSAEDAIEYFVTGLDAWFNEMDFQSPVILAGHSFGGYIAARYTMQHPATVARLVMCDSWGVNRPKENAKKSLPFRFRLALKLFDAGNPLAVLRAAGPWGPTLLPRVRKDFAQRYGKIYDDPMVFYNYVFHCNADSHATGEAGFKACSGQTPASAKIPLCDVLVPSLPKDIPLRMVYGAQTWMDHAAGAAVCDAVNLAGGDAKITFVQHAAHQLMIDNVEGFNDAFIAALQ
jgi:abhydrolase domain-containing protein 4